MIGGIIYSVRQTKQNSLGKIQLVKFEERMTACMNEGAPYPKWSIEVLGWWYGAAEFNGA